MFVLLTPKIPRSFYFSECEILTALPEGVTKAAEKAQLTVCIILSSVTACKRKWEVVVTEKL